MTLEHPVGKTKSQGWEIGVSRTLPVDSETAWDMILTALRLPAAVIDPAAGSPEKGKVLEAEDRTRIEIRSYEQYGLIRMKWQPPGWESNSTLQIRVRPARNGATISIHHEWLADAEQREAMRVRWTALLENIKASIN